MSERERTDFRFEIVEHIGVLTAHPTGWNKEINIVKWNDSQEKYDIRDWSPDHERMTKGVTMHAEEFRKLMELCGNRFCVAAETEAEAETGVKAEAEQ